MTKEQKIFERLANALQKLTYSASEHVGADCMLQALLAQKILEEEGIKTRLAVGEAAWRVGPGDGDVITHSPRIGGMAPAGEKAAAYHAWLEMGTFILDFSTHSLRHKAQSLDAMDGGKTTVQWCPSYLFIQKHEILSLRDVTQALNAGVACYQELPGLLTALVAKGMRTKVYMADVLMLRRIYDQPEIKVIGPNDLDAAFNRNVKAKAST